ncbi:ROK family transcriptional regulator [Streptomyces beijiangensis]|uniref:ROK family transcriptional regulator n=1 Tax=Streptomyces beijiangensis TaxID=163361 RepID=A0A939F8U0_9ACTN|nr:ROK family transcriptional regulator [Streptomyces beijiangensis]MBO0514033.1 ROK family transcriptional regulator [Streptomyces beijiangensis]
MPPATSTAPLPPPLLRALPAPLEPPGRADGTGPSAVLRTVLREGPLARTALSRTTGLSPAAVSRHTADLIGLGLLHELAPPAGPPRAGRPQIPVGIDPAHHVVCGVHIALTHTTFAVVDLLGRVTAFQRIPHSGDAPGVLGQILHHLPAFLARRAAGRSVLGIGVVTGGWVDSAQGVVVEHDPLGWRDIPVRETLAAGTRLPVHVDGHARALAQAELLFGAASRRTEMVQLFVANVVDAAIATGGSVLRGRRSGAGDVAHLPLGDPELRCGCGRRGCLQDAVSDRAVAGRAFEAGIIPAPRFPLLLQRAGDGDPAALRILRERLRTTGRACALLLDVINPEVLVLTDTTAIHLPELLPDLYEEIAAHSHLCTDPERAVVPTPFGSQVLGVAAGAVVLDAVYRRPMDLRTARSA